MKYENHAFVNAGTTNGCVTNREVRNRHAVKGGAQGWANQNRVLGGGHQNSGISLVFYWGGTTSFHLDGCHLTLLIPDRAIPRSINSGGAFAKSVGPILAPKMYPEMDPPEGRK